MISQSPFARRIIMKPPPPRLPADGQTTASASPTATAASFALPPRFITSAPTRDAISLVDATIPWAARTGSRDAARGASGNDVTNNRTDTASVNAGFFIDHLFIETYVPVDQARANKQ